MATCEFYFKNLVAGAILGYTSLQFFLLPFSLFSYLPLSLSLCLQKSEEPFGMNVAGGAGGTVGDLPIFISAIKQGSVIGRSGKIQVSLLIRTL